MKEENFKKLLLYKEHVNLSEDFDNNLMIIINKHALSKSTDKKYLKLMYLFFVLGLVLGFVIAVSFVDLDFLIGGNMLSINKLILQIPLIVIVLIIFEKIYKATLVSIGKEKFSSI